MNKINPGKPDSGELSPAIETDNLGGGEPENLTKPRFRIASEKQGWLNRFNESSSEWCSSILVKETRQSLKSRQFLWTYIVLLACVAIWTVLGLTFGAAQSYHYSGYQTGRELLFGFWVILGFPLGLIIPFTAYRSLAQEFEDGTIQLISITTMKPHQIVIGKFGSAILQMLIYLSVLAPCISFTYLLRGISLDQILTGLSICVGGSICLTITGLFLAGAIRSRALGIGVSVLFVLTLGWLYFIWCGLSYELTNYGGINWNEPEMAMATFGFVVFFGSTAALLLVTAASQISFPADNRSTAIRITMLVQQMLFVAFMVVLLPEGFRERDEFCLAMAFVIGHYWLIMGFLMIGESSELSRRMRRSLPRTFFSRSVKSLFMPGSGRGFLFAVANVWGCSAILLLLSNFDEFFVSQSVVDELRARWGGTGFRATRGSLDFETILSTFVSAVFVTWFLSVIFLVMRFMFEKRKRNWSTGTGPLISLLTGSLFVATILIGTAILHFNLIGFTNRDETSFLLVPNWYWATADISQGDTYFTQLPLIILFMAQALIVTLIAFVVASRDLLQRPVEVPQRVAVELLQERPSTLAKGESIDEIFGELKSDQ